MGWLAAFLFVVCGALRLARFNVQKHAVDGRYFVGLPIPAAAAQVAAWVHFHSQPLAGRDDDKRSDRIAPPRAAAELRRSFLLNLGYFWVGRFAGALPYFPGLAAALVLFLATGPRERDGWLALAGVVVACVGTLLIIPDNWYGGAGTIGNRYLLGFLPRFGKPIALLVRQRQPPVRKH